MSQALSRPLLALCSALCPTAPVCAQASGFAPRELLYLDVAIPGLPLSSAEILRIDPSTGTTSLLLELANAEIRADSMANDPYRERAIF